MHNYAYNDDYQPCEQDEIARSPAHDLTDNQKEGAGNNQRHSY